ncbi:hypothetical protein D3P07_08875 [Paenibacillus sp. 1011MAR3C5]|uniref:hypothetical protein n=1 Tax=Paenibacillus sp. 1011MAR3C5 TaxID=1675787 RepID=UPI000E6C6FE2|nr:hypothetical protein [Paenibacillus sp. 1011MAR3C5]RJE90305.1 hypothetical protein D3P07_08875 [Paenibacillus sp. 1011MAR3C5]
MKKFAYLSIILVIAVAAYFLYQFHRPIAIEQTYQGIVYDNDNSFTAQDSVYIKGELSRFLFGSDSIKGTLTAGERTYDIHLKKDRHYYFAVLTELKESHVTSIGSMYLTIDFNHIWLQLKDYSVHYPVDHGYFVNGAATIEEANEIVKNLLEKPFE